MTGSATTGKIITCQPPARNATVPLYAAGIVNGWRDAPSSRQVPDLPIHYRPPQVSAAHASNAMAGH
jgi:hypothetical protein